MNVKKQKLLQKKARDQGCKSVDEYILQCEFAQIIGKLNKSFERAVILPTPPEPWDVYLAMREREQINQGTKKKKF